MLEVALTSFTTFFATIGPVEAAVLFATLTPKMEQAARAAIAIRATAIAGSLLLIFTLFGQPLLDELGVSIAALQSAGGIILLLIALDMIFAKPTSAFKLTQPEDEEAQTKDDIAVFPLAMPLLAGPGAMSAGILLAANADGNALSLATTVGALAAVMAVTLALLLLSHQLNRMIGITAQRVLMRVFGILLAAIAVQAMFNGLASIGVIHLQLETHAGTPVRPPLTVSVQNWDSRVCGGVSHAVSAFGIRAYPPEYGWNRSVARPRDAPMFPRGACPRRLQRCRPNGQ
jgi:multiple antibiotic resistance protein